MKKSNIVFYVIGTICFLMAIYIIYDKYFADHVRIDFDGDVEIDLVNDKLKEVSSSLGWIVIVDAIDNQDENGNYNLTFNKNYFDNYSYRQLFVMEYILSYSNNYDMFTVLDYNGKKIDDIPTSDSTTSYIKYHDYNIYYKMLFGEDFDLDRAKKGSMYSDSHVYYENRRAGANGVYVPLMEAKNVSYKNGMFASEITMTYSSRASELLGSSSDTVILKYTKDINGNIIFNSFMVKDR